MDTSKERQEQKYYNKKLIKEDFQDEMKKPHKNDWIDFFSSWIGIFIGLRITHLTGIDTRIGSTAGRVMLGLLITVATLSAVKVLTNTLRRRFRKQ